MPGRATDPTGTRPLANPTWVPNDGRGELVETSEGLTYKGGGTLSEVTPDNKRSVSKPGPTQRNFYCQELISPLEEEGFSLFLSSCG